MKPSSKLLKSMERLEQAVKHLQGRHNQMSHGRGGGGGSGSVKPTGNHNVKLPKNPKKLNINTEFRALQQMGIQAQVGKYDMQNRQAQYKLTDSDGNSQTVSSSELKEIIYSNQVL